MLIHPQFNPVAVHLGPLSIHWYALSYILAFVLFMLLGRYRIRKGVSILNHEQLDDLLTYGILGVILGGRLGYVLFYNFSHFMTHPVDIFKVWQGGMSFHGGFLGVLIAVWLFAKKHGFSWTAVVDEIAPLVPLGLASGRIGNFINGELWGRITSPNAPWAMIFPQAQHSDIAALPNLSPTYHALFAEYQALPRHPSQLYEFLFEGIVLFIVLWIFSSRPRPLGRISALFLMGYGIARFCIEFTREPDQHLGLLSLGLSMGQWLSLPMIVIGIIWWIMAGKNPPEEEIPDDAPKRVI